MQVLYKMKLKNHLALKETTNSPNTKKKNLKPTPWPHNIYLHINKISVCPLQGRTYIKFLFVHGKVTASDTKQIGILLSLVIITLSTSVQ